MLTLYLLTSCGGNKKISTERTKNKILSAEGKLFKENSMSSFDHVYINKKEINRIFETIKKAKSQKVIDGKLNLNYSLIAPKLPRASFNFVNNYYEVLVNLFFELYKVNKITGSYKKEAKALLLNENTKSIIKALVDRLRDKKEDKNFNKMIDRALLFLIQFHNIPKAYSELKTDRVIKKALYPVDVAVGDIISSLKKGELVYIDK